MKKTESKYFYTASLMNQALLEILEKKEFVFITVRELCQKAGVNRSTFYLHYESMNELLNETIKSIENKFFDTFKEINLADIYEERLTTPKFLTPYLSFIKENKKIYKLIHQKPNLFGNSKMFNKMYKEIFEPTLTKYNVKENEKDYIFNFYTSGVLAIIKVWIENDCADEISNIVSLITKLTQNE